MFFQKRVDRALDYLKQKNGDASSPPLSEGFSEGYDPKREAEEAPLSEKLEKGDMAAMLVSAVLTLIPIAVLVLLGLVGLTRLILRV